jgi:hypothetical protein
MGPAELIVRLVSINVFSKNLRNMSTYFRFFNLAPYERLI